MFSSDVKSRLFIILSHIKIHLVSPGSCHYMWFVYQKKFLLCKKELSYSTRGFIQNTTMLSASLMNVVRGKIDDDR